LLIKVYKIHKSNKTSKTEQDSKAHWGSNSCPGMEIPHSHRQAQECWDPHVRLQNKTQKFKIERCKRCGGLRRRMRGYGSGTRYDVARVYTRVAWRQPNVITCEITARRAAVIPSDGDFSVHRVDERDNAGVMK